MDPDSELAWLTAAMCSGTLTAADRDRLERLLEDPEARRAYAAITEVHAGLQWRFRNAAGGRKPGHAHDPAGGAVPEDRQDPFPDNRAAFTPLGARVRRWLREAVGPLLRPAPLSLIIAALTLATGITAAAFVSVRRDDTRFVLRPRGPIVAEIVRQHRARWSDPLREPDPRLGLPAGARLDLADGLVELALSGGGRIILQGPAILDVLDGSAVHLAAGLLHGRFDVGKGDRARRLEVPMLEVRTPVATVTDLGTEFGVSVAGDGTSQVHVFEGLVELTPRVRDEALVPPRLGANDALQVDDQGRISPAGRDLARRIVRRIPGPKPPPDWVESRAVTLFHERFDVAGPMAGRAAILAVESPEGPRESRTVTWRTSSRGWDARDGVLCASSAGGVAALPFTPESGVVYRLSVTMDVTAGAEEANGWAAVGFLRAGAREFYKSQGGHAWTGQRTGRSPGLGGNFACGGPAIEGKIPNIDHRYGRHVRTVQLDTRGRPWRAKFLVDGDEVAWHVFADGPPPIRALGVGATPGITAEFRDLTLAVYRPDDDEATATAADAP